MSIKNKVIGGSKLFLIADKNGKKLNFITDEEIEKKGIKVIYYLWLSRLFILSSVISLFVFLSASLSLFNLAPDVTVEPFLIIDQKSSKDIVRYEPIAYNMASRNMMMETFVRQYIIYRNTIINDRPEMMLRWFNGGILNYLSAPKVFSEFIKYREENFKKFMDEHVSQEVEIISIGKLGGRKSPVWKVDFKTYEVSDTKRNAETGAMFLRVHYYTASVTSYFLPQRRFMSRRLLNPLGFTVTRYSQSEVDFF